MCVDITIEPLPPWWPQRELDQLRQFMTIGDGVSVGLAGSGGLAVLI